MSVVTCPHLLRYPYSVCVMCMLLFLNSLTDVGSSRFVVDIYSLSIANLDGWTFESFFHNSALRISVMATSSVTTSSSSLTVPQTRTVFSDSGRVIISLLSLSDRPIAPPRAKVSTYLLDSQGRTTRTLGLTTSVVSLTALSFFFHDVGWPAISICPYS